MWPHLPKLTFEPGQEHTVTGPEEEEARQRGHSGRAAIPCPLIVYLIITDNKNTHGTRPQLTTTHQRSMKERKNITDDALLCTWTAGRRKCARNWTSKWRSLPCQKQVNIFHLWETTTEVPITREKRPRAIDIEGWQPQTIAPFLRSYHNTLDMCVCVRRAYFLPRRRGWWSTQLWNSSKTTYPSKSTRSSTGATYILHTFIAWLNTNYSRCTFTLYLGVAETTCTTRMERQSLNSSRETWIMELNIYWLLHKYIIHTISLIEPCLQHSDYPITHFRHHQ